MRKLWSMLAAAAGVALLAGTASAQSPGKIAYIDSRKLIAEAPGAKEAQSTFEKEMQGYQAQMKVMEDSLKAMMDEYQQKSVVYSPEVKRQKEEAIRAKQEAYQQKAQQLEEQAGRRQSELVQPIMDRIKTVISDLRKEGGYAVIFDIAGNSGLVSADPSLDITDQVLTRLKQTASTAGAAKPGATAAPTKKP